MKKLEWCDALSIGIESLDNQHKHFIDLVNRARSLSAKKKCSKKDASELVAEIEAYARKHFDTEEKLFNEFDYPKAAEHELEHVKLLGKVQALYDGMLFESVTINQVVDLLDDWLENHLLKYDMDYARFINTKKECGEGFLSWFCRVMKKIKWFLS